MQQESTAQLERTDVQKGTKESRLAAFAGVDRNEPLVTAEVEMEPSADPVAKRMEELGRIILAYSEITERLQTSHDILRQQVERMGEELSEKNRQLERRNRLAALGEMAAGMAHEIRNPLGAIQLYAGMLGSELSRNAVPLGYVRKISAGVRRMEGVVGQVLDFARELRPQRQVMDLVELIREQAEFARTASTATIEVSRIGAGDIGWPIDPLLMGQVVLNLLTNAADAAGPCGHVRATSERMTEAEVKVTISDSGPGVPEELLTRIFDPFFTTKGRGTGLGLAIVHRVVEAHGGSITVRNTPDSGAVFEIVLPWVDAGAAGQEESGIRGLLTDVAVADDVQPARPAGSER